MPSSTWVHTSHVCSLLWKFQPASVLDLGVGFGRWGFLAREILDVFKGRIDEYSWKTRIVGVEIFSDYIAEHHRKIYDEIIYADALSALQLLATPYDVIIAGDIIEHFERERGEELLRLAAEKATIAAIFCVPIGDKYPQGVVAGNEHEAHRSVWDAEFFRTCKHVTEFSVFEEQCKRRPYGVAVCERKLLNRGQVKC